MAVWTNPKTWAPGAQLPASELNTYLRDNTIWLHDNLGGAWVDASSETWTYLSADAPTFQLLVANADRSALYGPGTRIKLTQSSTVRYFIVTAVSYSAPNTIVTLYGGTDYTLANAAISAQQYAYSRFPPGFPSDPSKWTVLLTDSTDRSQNSPTNGTWYNPGAIQIVVPIGVWDVDWRAAFGLTRTGGGTVKATLSTTSSSESDPDLTAGFKNAADGASSITTGRTKLLLLAAKTTYFMNIAGLNSSISSIYFESASTARLVVRAVCAYL